MLSVGMFSFPLPRSLSRYAPAVRLRRAAGACVEKPEKTEQPHDGKKERPHGRRFSIGSAPPDKHHRKTLKSVVAKPDRTIKIPIISDRWLPRALSCSCLSVYRCHSAVMAAVSHSTPDTQFREGSSLQAGLYARTPRSVRLLRLIR